MMQETASPEIVKDTAPHCELMEVTPELAAQWLKKNTHNRRKNIRHVERLARDMVAGRFKLSHQGIAFSNTDCLIDGQNRLAAVILAKRPVEMYVWFNMPMAAQAVADLGEQRNTADVLTLTDRFGNVHKREIATLRAMMTGMKEHQKFTAAEEGELLARHREAITFALIHGYCKVKGIFTAITMAVVARAWYTADRQKLTTFCEIMRTGSATGENQGAATILWAWLVRAPTMMAATQHNRYAKTERALEAFLKGENLEKLYITRYELFPLPEEMPAKEEPVTPPPAQPPSEENKAGQVAQGSTTTVP
jgi:hypothetical protein